MIQYIYALEFIALGLLAAVYHWYKKRYRDKTTLCNLREYLEGRPGSTQATLWAIIMAETALSYSHSGGWLLTVSETVAALGLGYAADSSINKASDAAAPMVEDK